MKTLLRLVRREPVLFTTLVQTGISLVTAFGLNLTAEQQAAILAFTGAVLALCARRLTVPVHRPPVKKKVEEI